VKLKKTFINENVTWMVDEGFATSTSTFRIKNQPYNGIAQREQCNSIPITEIGEENRLAPDFSMNINTLTRIKFPPLY